MVKYLPSKEKLGVRFPLPAPKDPRIVANTINTKYNQIKISNNNILFLIESRNCFGYQILLTDYCFVIVTCFLIFRDSVYGGYSEVVITLVCGTGIMGSIPVSRPIDKLTIYIVDLSMSGESNHERGRENLMCALSSVDRAPGFGPGGRGSESLRAYQEGQASFEKPIIQSRTE